MDIWPNFFLVGTSKAGTTSLYHYLKDIPSIFMSPVKEPNFFSAKTIPEDHPMKPLRDKTKYLSLFKKVKNERIIGEASPSYLADPEAPILIHKVSPNAKILISLRDPVERIFSAYLMFVRLGVTKSSFHDELKKEFEGKNVPNTAHIDLKSGLFSENVKQYLNIFGKVQVKVIIFEELIVDTKKTVEDILQFLGIDYQLKNFKSEVFNPFAVPRGDLAQNIMQNDVLQKIVEKGVIPTPVRKFVRERLLLKQQTKPVMEENDRKALISYFGHDVEKLKTILGRDLPWKNFYDHSSLK